MPQQLVYPSDYSAARREFRERVARRGGHQESLTIAARGPLDESLSIDTAWIGNQTASNVLLYVSGVHGLEGFVGSALQCALLDDLPAMAPDLAILMVHCVNPFGMAWLRRVNESNVDLNRNCLGPGDSYAGMPPDYARLQHLLNPPSAPPRIDGSLYARGLWEVARHGKMRLAQAIAGGQYEQPQGLFFGGHRLEEGPRQFFAWLRKRLRHVQRVFLLDVHTGLGKYSDDVLLIGQSADSPRWRVLQPIFGPRLRGPVGGTYQVSGGFYAAVERELGNRQCWSAVHEFGTYSGLRVLAALRAENRLWWYGPREDLNHPIKQRIREAFAPRSSRWRSVALRRGRATFCQALDVLTSAAEGGDYSG